ncbi:MAG TPA: NAD-dependent epimerase/dehydratase family protein [Dehalococcoidales bacterium]|nr:NAD-dependent epimerase/dehydratase family protein [Dehalococcoidales bacterium]
MAKLITGGLGFIGSRLAGKLVEQGEDVVLFDITTQTKLVDDIKDKVKIVRGDLTNWARVLHVVKEYDIDCIYHTGALLSAMAEEDPLATCMVNANGTLYVLEAARLFEVKKVIYLSSAAVYGPGLPERIGDDDIQRPTTMYGVTKVFCERLGEYYHRKFGLNFRAVRFPSIIGPGRAGGGASAYTSIIIQEAAAGRRYEVFVDEDARTPMMYVKDAVRSLIQLEQAEEKNLKRRVYSIEGFTPTPRAIELANAVKKYVPDARIEFCPVPEMVDIVHNWAQEIDGRNARQDWGFKAQYTLDEAIADFVNEFRARPDLY